MIEAQEKSRWKKWKDAAQHCDVPESCGFATKSRLATDRSMYNRHHGSFCFASKT